MSTQQLRFDDVADGDEVAAWTAPQLTRTMFVRYAGASGDFNPIHHDEEFAKSAGYPTVFGHGMLTAGILSRYVTDLAGVGNVRLLRVRFATQVWPGDSLTCTGKVAKKYSEGDENRVDLELTVVNQKGVAAVQGFATVAV
jgi:acyl dehydratase